MRSYCRHPNLCLMQPQMFSNAGLGPEPAGFVRAVFSLYDQQEIETLLKEAGFMDITIRVDKKPLRLPPPKEFLAQYISGMPFSAAASKLNDEEYTALEREMVERWDPFGRRWESDIRALFHRRPRP